MAHELSTKRHWLDLYASSLYDWQKNGNVYHRRQGIVENLFDIDGFDYEGRADINANLRVELKTALDQTELRERISLAWSVLRQQHVLLSARSVHAADFLPGVQTRKWVDKCFVYELPENPKKAMQEACDSIVFVADAYPKAKDDQFYAHLMNTARVIDGDRCLSKLFVLPLVHISGSFFSLRFNIVMAHQIADGLTTFRWAKHLIDLLNLGQHKLEAALQQLCTDTNALHSRLPPPQEALYPPRASSKALSRWQWIITRLLRHVQKPASDAFQNPLRRLKPLSGAEDLPPEYSNILNYNQKPPLNCFSQHADLSQRATHNLIRLCREAGISVGSGCFTLVALVMMHFEEIREPNTSMEQRLPFVGSFPVNPRPFLSGNPTTGKEDSLMLAFSEGITLPFLPRHLDLAKRLKILGRLAHRQLRQYQKRPRSLTEELHLGARSPSQLLPMLYLSTMERLDGKVKPDQRVGFDPQGGYPVGRRYSPATCGISSVGDRTGLIRSGLYSLDNLGDQDLAVDFRSLGSSVRARDGEFLVGAAGTKDELGFMVSYDGSAIDPEKVQEWKSMIESILDIDMAVSPTSEAPQTLVAKL